MARSCDKGFVICCLVSSCFGLGIVVLMVMLSLFSSPSSPSFSINLFDNQALNKTGFTTIYFDLNLKNRNSAIGLYYTDQLNITFSYFPNVSMIVSLADYKLDGFYQGKGKGRLVSDMVETSSFPRVLEGTNIVAFRVDLVASYKHKLIGSKRHKVALGCVVGVNVSDSTNTKRVFIRLVEPGLDSKLMKEIPRSGGY